MENRINITIELQKAVANGKPDFLSQTVYLQLNDFNQKKCISLSITAAVNLKKKLIHERMKYTLIWRKTTI